MTLLGRSDAEKTEYVHARDAILPIFRQRILEKLNITLFEHQAAWMLAGDGLILTPDAPADDEPFSWIQLADKTTVKRKVVPRPGGPARILADLGSFKIGKSLGSGVWMASFAVVPNARVSLVGLEYDTCEPEFEYLCEILLSERGFNLRPASHQNRPRDGKMWLDLDNGVRYDARSWERKDALKGKERDAYVYAEAYQLPGIECYTSVSQNLSARRGYAVFPTTGDRPWVKEFHVRGHDPVNFPEWSCTCGTPRKANPYTYDPKDEIRDRGIMTREKFAIHYTGGMGEYVGSVFSYQRGQRVFTRQTHPDLWKPGDGMTPELLKLPTTWDVLAACDSGTFYAGLIVAFDQDGTPFVLEEFTNYRYVAGEIEIDDLQSIPKWAKTFRRALDRYRTPPHRVWTDRQNQIKGELRHYRLICRSVKDLRETRTEIAREFFQLGKVWLAPWLDVLPVELELAAWPEGFARIKVERTRTRDHVLDCFEHLASLRPMGKAAPPPKAPGRFRDQLLAQMRAGKQADPHFGLG